MKKIFLSTCLLFSFVFFVIGIGQGLAGLDDFQGQSSEPIVFRVITNDSVESCKTQINRLIAREMYIRYGIKGASLGIAVGLSVYMLWSDRGTSDDSLMGQGASLGSEALLYKMQDELAEVRRVVAWLHPVSEKGDWFGWVKCIAIRVRNAAIGPVGYFFIQKLFGKMKQYFEEKNLGWFVTRHTKVPFVLSQMRHAGEQLHDPHKKLYQENFYLKTLPRLCDDLLGDVERVIAFMEYTIDQVPKGMTAAYGLSMMSSYVIQCVNDRLAKIGELLSIPDQDKREAKFQELETTIILLETEITNTIERFKHAIEEINRQ